MSTTNERCEVLHLIRRSILLIVRNFNAHKVDDDTQYIQLKK